MARRAAGLRARQLDRLAGVHDVVTRTARRIEQDQSSGAAIWDEAQSGVVLRQADEEAAVFIREVEGDAAARRRLLVPLDHAAFEVEGVAQPGKNVLSDQSMHLAFRVE